LLQKTGHNGVKTYSFAVGSIDEGFGLLHAVRDYLVNHCQQSLMLQIIDLQYFIAVESFEVGTEGLVSCGSGSKHIEDRIIGEGGVDVEQSPA
jgi:hypothetical protein